MAMHVFSSVLIDPLYVQASVTQHPLLEAIFHGCYVIATYDKVDLFKTAPNMWCNIRMTFEVFIIPIFVWLPLPHSYTVSYIIPTVWYAYFILQWSKTIKALDIGDCNTKVKENVQRCNFWFRVKKDCQSIDSTLTDTVIDHFEAHG